MIFFSFFHSNCKIPVKFNNVAYTVGRYLSTPETRFSEILDFMNKLQLPFSYFTLYSDSI